MTEDLQLITRQKRQTEKLLKKKSWKMVAAGLLALFVSTGVLSVMGVPGTQQTGVAYASELEDAKQATDAQADSFLQANEAQLEDTPQVSDTDPVAENPADENPADTPDANVCTRHTWNKGEVVLPATTEHKGLKMFTCTKCGKTKSRMIPIIQEKQENPLKVKVRTKTYKQAGLNKVKTFRIKARKAKGKVTYKRNKDTKKARIKVTRKGKVKIPKHCKKGIYKITVKAKGNRRFLSAMEVVTIYVN